MRLAALILALVLPVQALALSCVRPDVVRSYAEAAQAEESYVVVRGRLTFDAAAMPRSHSASVADVTYVAAQLVGKSLSRAGFDAPFQRDIRLAVACYGPWCGGGQSGADVLAFLRHDAQGYTLDVLPCGGRVFASPKRATLKRIALCHRTGSCT